MVSLKPKPFVQILETDILMFSVLIEKPPSFWVQMFSICAWTVLRKHPC